MLISPAYAQGAGGGSGVEAFIPLILIFVIFYFLLIRPQQKKMKQHRSMLESVRRGDKVVTGGGIMGTVTKVMEGDEVIVEIADKVKVHIRKSTLAHVDSKSEPQKANAKADKGDKGDKGDKDDKSGKADAANDDGGKKKAGGLRGLLGGNKES